MPTPDIIVQIKGGATKVITQPSGSATRLVDLIDVSATPRANGDLLTFVVANNRFEFHPGQGGGSAFDQFARDTANGAFGRANAAFANANSAIYTADQIRANVSNTAPINYNSTSGVISHADSGVTATTYGNTTFVPVVTIDARGHVTSVVNTAIALPPSTDEFARAHANAAYNQANAANTVAASAFDQANGAFGRANAAFANANSAIYTADQIRANVSNTAPINYEPSTGIFSHANSSVTPTTYGNATFVPVVTIDARGHVTSVVNTAISFPPGGVTSVAGRTGAIVLDTFDVTENASGPYYHTTARVRGNVSATAPINYVSGTGVFSHDTSGVTATGHGSASIVPVFLVNSTGHVTSVTNTTIAIAASAVTSGILAVARGGTGKDATGIVNGSIFAGNTVNTGFDITTIAQTAPVIVTNGRGTITLSHASSGVVATGHGTAAIVPVFVVNEFGHLTSVTNTAIAITSSAVTESGGGPFFHSAARVRGNVSNTTPVNYDSTTGIFSHALSGVVATTYGNTTFVPTITVDARGHVTSVTNTAIDLPPSTDEFARAHANAAYNQANTANTVAASAFDQANIARSNADAAFANANSAIYTADQIRANVSNTAPINYDPSTGNVSHADSGVVAGNYGTSLFSSRIFVDSTGHVTSAANVTIQLSADSIISGTLVAARGGTGQTAITVDGSLLIGNTVSGGYDVNTLTQGTGIVITNDAGSITIATTGGSALDQFARDTANGAFGRANAAFANANSAIYTADQIRANVSNTAPINYNSTSGVISHADSGVTATTYGTAAEVPVFTVNTFGLVTAVTNTAIAVAASAITSGTLVAARGGTGQTAVTLNGSILIANSVSAGYDLNRLIAGAGILINNDKGSIEIASAGGSSTDQFARDTANSAARNSFVTVAVTGQDNVVADSNTDTLTLVAGAGITITTNATTDSITFVASGVTFGQVYAFSLGFAMP